MQSSLYIHWRVFIHRPINPTQGLGFKRTLTLVLILLCKFEPISCPICILCWFSYFVLTRINAWPAINYSLIIHKMVIIHNWIANCTATEQWLGCQFIESDVWSLRVQFWCCCWKRGKVDRIAMDCWGSNLWRKHIARKGGAAVSGTSYS